jgi:hypothetical protein
MRGIVMKRFFNGLVILSLIVSLVIACRAYFSWSVKRFNRQAVENAPHLSDADMADLNKAMGLSLPANATSNAWVGFQSGDDYSNICIRLDYPADDPREFLRFVITDRQPQGQGKVDPLRNRPHLPFPEKLDWWDQNKVDGGLMLFSGNDDLDLIIVADKSADAGMRTYYISETVKNDQLTSPLIQKLTSNQLEKDEVISLEDFCVSRYP